MPLFRHNAPTDSAITRTRLLRVDEFEKQRIRERLNILDGFVAALHRRDEVLAVLESCATDADARTDVAALLGVDEWTALAVLDLQLRRFTGQSRDRIKRERDELQATLDER